MTTQERIDRITEAAEEKGVSTMFAWKALGLQENGLNRINNVFLYVIYKQQQGWHALRLAGARCADRRAGCDRIVYSDALLRILDGDRAKAIVASPDKLRPGEKAYRAALVKTMEPGVARNHFNDLLPGDTNFLKDLYELFAQSRGIRHRFQKPDLLLASYNADDVVPSTTSSFLTWISAHAGRPVTTWADGSQELHSINERGEGVVGRMASGRFLNPYHYVRGRGIPYLRVPEDIFPTSQHPSELSFSDEDFKLEISANPTVGA